MIEWVKAIAQVDLPVFESDRRPGDPTSVMAAVERISQVLGWQPQYNDLDVIIQTTLNWERQRLKTAHPSHLAQSSNQVFFEANTQRDAKALETSAAFKRQLLG